jgi:hypothetical protein
MHGNGNSIISKNDKQAVYSESDSKISHNRVQSNFKFKTDEELRDLKKRISKPLPKVPSEGNISVGMSISEHDVEREIRMSDDEERRVRTLV